MRTENPYKLKRVAVRLVKEACYYAAEPITSPEKAVSLLGKELSQIDREVVAVINMDTKGLPINCTFVSMGTLNEAMVHPREMLKASILSNASSIIMLHNHPSGNVTPSLEDKRAEKRMREICDLVGIPLIDSIIVGKEGEYYSFRERMNAVKEQEMLR